MISLSQETEALARRLAELRRVPVEDAIREALEVGVRAVDAAVPPRSGLSPAAIAARRRVMEQAARDVVGMPILDPRLVADIMDELNAI